MRSAMRLSAPDVVLDCTDNMATRQEINAACVALDTPLITASAVGFGGQLMVADAALGTGLLPLPMAG
ncbi:adenylyltransferase [Citrobacter koseri]|uniref:Adenylyltransferase n=1 Tax=Citrobacter koseri TaxID=545 RepID=A0A2X2WES6_CITKO|nr:adenylyltransferase [Citrobacter koseri]